MFIAEDENALDRVKEDQQRLSEVGRIDIEIWRVTHIEVPVGTGYVKASNIEAPNTPVHEKALKGEAKYHSVG